VASTGRRARPGYWFVAPATAVLVVVLILPVLTEI
jgi:ABC-type sugar transport system permease subunit